MQIDQNKVELAIVEQVAGELIEADGLRDLVAKTVERRIDNIFKETADKQTRAENKQLCLNYVLDGRAGGLVKAFHCRQLVLAFEA